MDGATHIMPVDGEMTLVSKENAVQADNVAAPAEPKAFAADVKKSREVPPNPLGTITNTVGSPAPRQAKRGGVVKKSEAGKPLAEALTDMTPDWVIQTEAEQTFDEIMQEIQQCVGGDAASTNENEPTHANEPSDESVGQHNEDTKDDSAAVQGAREVAAQIMEHFNELQVGPSLDTVSPTEVQNAESGPQKETVAAANLQSPAAERPARATAPLSARKRTPPTKRMGAARKARSATKASKSRQSDRSKSRIVRSATPSIKKRSTRRYKSPSTGRRSGSGRATKATVSKPVTTIPTGPTPCELCSDMNTKLVNATQDSKEYKRQYDFVVAESTRLYNVYQVNCAEMREVEKENVKLKEAFEVLEKERAAAIETGNKTYAVFEKVRDELQGEKARFDALVAEHEKLAAEKEKLAATVEDMGGADVVATNAVELEAATCQRMRLEGEVARLEDALQSIRSELKAASEYKQRYLNASREAVRLRSAALASSKAAASVARTATLQRQVTEQLARCKALVETRTSALVEATARCTSLEAEVEGLRAEAEASSAAREEVSSAVHALVDRVCHDADLRAAKEAWASRAEKAASRAASERGHLEAAAQAAEDEHAAEMAFVQEEHRCILSNLEGKLSEARAALDKVERDANTKAARHTLAVEEWSTEKTRLEGRVQQLEERVQELESAVATGEQALAEARNEGAEAAKASSDREAESVAALQALTAEVTRVRTELAEQKAEVERATSEAKKLGSDKAAYEKKKAMLMRGFEQQLEQMGDQMKQERARAEATFASVRADLLAKLDAAVRDRRVLKSKAEQLYKEAVSAKRQSEASSKIVDKLKAENERLAARLKEIRSARNDLSGQNAALEKNANTLRRGKQALQDKVGALEGENVALKSRAEFLTSQLEVTTARAHKAERKWEAVGRDAGSLKVKLDEEARKHKETRDAKDSEIRALKSSVAALQAAKRTAQVLQAKLEDAQSANNELKQDMQTLRNTVANKKGTAKAKQSLALMKENTALRAELKDERAKVVKTRENAKKIMKHFYQHRDYLNSARADLGFAYKIVEAFAQRAKADGGDLARAFRELGMQKLVDKANVFQLGNQKQ